MNDRSIFLLPDEESATTSPEREGSETVPLQFVRQDRYVVSDDARGMEDSALLSHIIHCGIQMQAAYKLGMKGEAHSWRQRMEAALREKHRRPHLVEADEQAKGLA